MKGWVGLVGWLVVEFTHVSGHPSATGRVQDKESSPAKDQRSTAVLRNQLVILHNGHIYCIQVYNWVHMGTQQV